MLHEFVKLVKFIKSRFLKFSFFCNLWSCYASTPHYFCTRLSADRVGTKRSSDILNWTVSCFMHVCHRHCVYVYTYVDELCHNIYTRLFVPSFTFSVILLTVQKLINLPCSYNNVFSRPVINSFIRVWILKMSALIFKYILHFTNFPVLTASFYSLLRYMSQTRKRNIRQTFSTRTIYHSGITRTY
jgi:hypothetical protein